MSSSLSSAGSGLGNKGKRKAASEYSTSPSAVQEARRVARMDESQKAIFAARRADNTAKPAARAKARATPAYKLTDEKRRVEIENEAIDKIIKKRASKGQTESAKCAILPVFAPLYRRIKHEQEGYNAKLIAGGVRAEQDMKGEPNIKAESNTKAESTVKPESY